MAKIIPSPLYTPEQEHDACGVGFIAKLTGERSYDVLNRAISALKALAHRGAIDADAVTGDGAGILTQLPVELFKDYLADLDTENDNLVKSNKLSFVVYCKKLKEALDAGVGNGNKSNDVKIILSQILETHFNRTRDQNN